VDWVGLETEEDDVIALLFTDFGRVSVPFVGVADDGEADIVTDEESAGKVGGMPK
jgi:hypothetical protein